MSYSQTCLFLQKNGVEDRLYHVITKKIGPVIYCTILQLIIHYIASMTIIFLMNQNKLILSQLQVAKLSMRVLVNHLNEAIFLKCEDGKLSYCNDLGVKIV